ncbi:hypothetical protein WJX72_001232 [[Myrmecia] bisecta]|uniref:Major facilitator superfamily (MFS) profile domain-containing protein n=1 Tax=[Myrmecia] bisecta TaxID=41462 RepID=A0AAW1R510_9CHLO
MQPQGLHTTSGNPLAETLQQLYLPADASVGNSQQPGYVIYNDAFPNGTVSFQLAHAKGVLGFDGQQGFWLVHSLPHFPEAPRKGHYRGIDLPQQLYAQSLLCISVNATMLDAVASLLRTSNLYLYETAVPDQWADMYPGMRQLIEGARDGVPLTSSFTLTTLGNQTFSAFAKGSTNMETGPKVYLYEQLVEPHFHTSMFIETWQRNGAMPSYCIGPLAQYDSLNIRSIHFREAEEAWSYSLDHSKWAVSSGESIPPGCMAAVEDGSGGSRFHRDGTVPASATFVGTHNVNRASGNCDLQSPRFTAPHYAASEGAAAAAAATAAEELQRADGLKYARLWYFTHSVALVFVLPYLNLHYRHLGFTAQQIGILGALRPWVSAPAGPMWAALADATKAHRLILVAAFALSTCTRTSMAVSGSFVVQMVLTVLTEAFGAPIGIIADSSVMASVKEEGDYGKQRMWGAIGWGGMSAFAGMLVSAKGMNAAFITYFLASIAALVPTSLLPVESLQTKEHKPPAVSTITLDDDTEVLVEPPAAYFTKQKLLFSLDIDLTEAEEAAILSDEGYIARHSSHGAAGPSNPINDDRQLQTLWDSVQNNIVPALGLELAERSQAREQGTTHAKLGFWDAVKVLIADPEVVAFFITSLVMGFASGTIGGYLFLFLDELGATETLMGVAISVACLTEVPMFFFAGKIIDKLGVKNVLNIAVGAYVLRLMCYSMLGSFGTPWAVLPIECLHGVTFGCSWAAGTVNCARISPPGLKSTTQAIFAGLYFGVGTGLGALIGGFIYQEYGAPAVFRTAAVGVAGAWLLCNTVPLLLRKGKAKLA